MKDLRTPREQILRTDFFVMAFNPDRLSPTGLRIVDLACGHKALTKLRRTVICPRCSEMMRRSLLDGSEDWVSFRNGDVRDRMVWPDDPCRQFHESTDLADNFLNDRGDDAP